MLGYRRDELFRRFARVSNWYRASTLTTTRANLGGWSFASGNYPYRSYRRANVVVTLVFVADVFQDARRIVRVDQFSFYFWRRAVYYVLTNQFAGGLASFLFRLARATFAYMQFSGDFRHVF